METQNHYLHATVYFFWKFIVYISKLIEHPSYLNLNAQYQKDGLSCVLTHSECTTVAPLWENKTIAIILCDCGW
jgi:hypothetical protein